VSEYISDATVQKFGVCKIFKNFFKEFSYAHLHLFKHKYNKYSHIVNYFYNLKLLYSILKGQFTQKFIFCHYFHFDFILKIKENI